MSLLDLYRRYVVDLDSKLARMSRKGIRIDLQRRAEMLAAASAEAEQLRVEMNAVVPDAVKLCEPKNGFVRDPKDTTGLSRRSFAVKVKVCPKCGVHSPKKKDLLLCGITKADLIEVDDVVERWCRLVPFTPSNVQTLRYARAMGHPVQFSTKKKPGRGKEKSATADEKALQRMLKKVPADPLYPLILRYREVDHRIGQIESLTIGPDQRIHTTFLHTPSTMRLASGFPAMQNIPPDLRDLLIASVGHRLFCNDYSGIEAQLVGYEITKVNPLAGRDYIRLAKLGIHAFFMSHVIGKPVDLKWSNADIKGYFSELKGADPKRYKACKQTIHASNYRETPYGMHMQQPGIFPTVREAEQYQKLYYEVVPDLTKWHWHTCEQAEKDGQLRNAWGFPHRFYDVFHYHKDEANEWQKDFGPMANAAIAFRPQSNAAFIMRQTIVDCPDELLDCLMLSVHDELVGEAPVDRAEQAWYTLKHLMERPIPQLPLNPEWGLGSFLAIETEGAIGERWGAIH